MLRVLTATTTLYAVSAFAPSSSAVLRRTALQSEAVDAAVPEPPPPPAYPTLNGWTYDPDAFCGGLPGTIEPLPDFDPLGFSKDVSLSDLKKLREAEVQHGRVAMMAVVGYIAGEAIVPYTGSNFIIPEYIAGPANYHLQQQSTLSFALFTFVIGVTEITRAIIGWTKPTEGLFGIKEGYYPGDFGFDPLGLKPAGAKDFAEMATKEISNGRLAMIAILGFWAQELVDGEGIVEHFAESVVAPFVFMV